MNKKLVLQDLPTVISTPRLVIRAMQAGDGPAIHEATLDGYEDARKDMLWPVTPPTAEQVEYETRLEVSQFIARTQMRFVIIQRDTGQLIGRMSFPAQLCVWQIPTIAIGYFLRKSAQGNGYATEATNAMVRYAFNVIGARKVEIYCLNNNLKSMAVPQRLNIPRERTQRGNWPLPGEKELSVVHVYACFDTQSLPPLEVTW